MNKRSCWLLPLDVPIMGATDRIGSKVNWRVRVVNWIADVRFWGACVGRWIADVEVWIVDVEI